MGKLNLWVTTGFAAVVSGVVGGFIIFYRRHLDPVLTTIGLGIIVVLFVVYRRERRLQNTLSRNARLITHVTDNAVAGMFTLDSDGLITFVNPAAETITGFSSKELEGVSFQSQLRHATGNDNSPPPSECLFMRSFVTHQPIRSIELEFVRRDGTFYPAISSIIPVVEDGKLVSAVVEIWDISDIKRIESELLNQGEQRSTLVELGNMALVNHTPQELMDRACVLLVQVLQLNYVEIHKVLPDRSGLVYQAWSGWKPRMEDLVAFGSQAGYTLSADHPVVVDDMSTESRFATTLSDVGVTGSVSVIIKWSAKSWGVLSVYTKGCRKFTEKDVAFLQATANLIGHVLERDQYVSDLKAALEVAESANKSKDNFLAIVSHELRTPLTPVAAAISSLLEWNDLPSLYRELLITSSDNLKIEMRLINDLLDVMRIVQDKLHYWFEVVDVHDILDEALGLCQVGEVGRRIEVVKHLDAANPFMNGDKTRLLQVFWNLIGNAVKFTVNHGADQSHDKLTITSSNVRRGDRMLLVMSFADTGVGISAGVIDHIFNVFDQGGKERPTARKHGGLGLGLTLSKSIVETHGGVITVSSAGEGEGSEFVVELPVIGELMEVDKNTTTSASPVRLFYVEDDKATSTVFKILLKHGGFDVTHFSDMHSAIKGISGDFDIVLSDISLPDGDGWTVMREIKRLWGDIPGIALSGFGSPEDVRRSNDAGFNEHWVKPVEPFSKLTNALLRLARRPT